MINQIHLKEAPQDHVIIKECKYPFEEYKKKNKQTNQNIRVEYQTQHNTDLLQIVYP